MNKNIKDNILDVEYKNKKEAQIALRESGKDINDYKILYAYEGMARKPYSSGYEEAHRRAAREYRKRHNLNTGNPRGRPKKIN